MDERVKKINKDIYSAIENVLILFFVYSMSPSPLKIGFRLLSVILPIPIPCERARDIHKI